MTAAEFLAKWNTDAEAMQRRGVMVNGAGLLSEVLADFKALMAGEGEAVLSLPQAAARSGYSADHLGRLVREGRVPNAGRKGAPRVRVADLPRKPACLPGSERPPAV